MRAGRPALPKKGATTSKPVTREPAIIQAVTVRSIEVAIGISNTITKKLLWRPGLPRLRQRGNAETRRAASLRNFFSHLWRCASRKGLSSDKRVEVGPHADGEEHQLAQHPGKKQQDGRGHRRQTRDGGESLILQGREHLGDIDE